MTTNRSMPPGTIIPELAYQDVGQAATWLCKTFGFKERLRIGNHRRQLVFGDASVVVIELSGEHPAGTGAVQPLTHKIMVHVPDVDQHYEIVKQSGAKILSEPQTYPFGERQYTVQDLGGHVWTFSQSVADIPPEEWGGQLVNPSLARKTAENGFREIGPGYSPKTPYDEEHN
jgi:uncharacterized glyoxalase superfamily protein PhnB